jgi:hypothetical protein
LTGTQNKSKVSADAAGFPMGKSADYVTKYQIKTLTVLVTILQVQSSKFKIRTFRLTKNGESASQFRKTCA